MTLIAMKMPPEMGGEGIKVGGSEVEVTCAQGGGTKLRQKCIKRSDGIQHVRTEHDISLQIVGDRFPGGCDGGNICYSSFASALLKIMQHSGIGFYGDDVPGLWREGQGKTS